MEDEILIAGDPAGVHQIDPLVYKEVHVDLSDEMNVEYRCEACGAAGCVECYHTGNKFVKDIIRRMLFNPTMLK